MLIYSISMPGEPTCLVKFSLVGFNDAFNTIMLCKRQYQLVIGNFLSDIEYVIFTCVLAETNLISFNISMRSLVKNYYHNTTNVKLKGILLT